MQCKIIKKRWVVIFVVFSLSALLICSGRVLNVQWTFVKHGPERSGDGICTFENPCVQDLGLPLGDGATKLILNTKGTPDDEMGIDVFYKANAYACLYKSSADKGNI